MTTLKVWAMSLSREENSDVFVGGQLTCFFFQHDRDIVADRVRQTIGLADQFLVFPVIDQRSLANRAGQNIEQFLVQERVFLVQRIEQPGDEGGVEMRLGGH